MIFLIPLRLHNVALFTFVVSCVHIKAIMNSPTRDNDMPKIKEYQLHPCGWENDPEEERYRLSTLDYLTTTTFTNTAFFFRLEEPEKP
jgi:hypothetical protein